MDLKINKTELKDILPFRVLFLQESNFQVRYNACHERGWTDSWLISIDDISIGYGSIKGKEDLTDRDAIFEFYVTPEFRKYNSLIFQELIKVAKTAYIECQSNDLILSPMMYEFVQNINSDVVLFSDHSVTAHIIPGIIFRERGEDDHLFKHNHEPDGSHILALEATGEIVATGGFLRHYNMPFADLYMEVREDMRRKGYGSLLLQEVKKVCYLSGRVPAARCGISNKASKATLLKAGMEVAGYMLLGKVKN